MRCSLRTQAWDHEDYMVLRFSAQKDGEEEDRKRRRPERAVWIRGRLWGGGLSRRERKNNKEMTEAGSTVRILVPLFSSAFHPFSVWFGPSRCVHSLFTAVKSVLKPHYSAYTDWKYNTRHTPHCESRYTCNAPRWISIPPFLHLNVIWIGWLNGWNP